MKLVVGLVFVVGCATQSSGPAVVSLAAPLPMPTLAAPESPSWSAAKTDDSSDFSSDRGIVRLTPESDGTLSGTYADGVLTCARPDAKGITCKWYEASNEGRAAFVRKDDGTLEGTWGTGESIDDGGAWTLVPLVRGAGLGGAWHTNWGIAHVTDTGHGIHVDYVRGTMDCEPRASQHLRCDWSEGSASGRAELVIESQSVLRGTWGSGASADDGGLWVFVRH